MTMTVRRIAAATAAGALVLIAVWYLALFKPQSNAVSAAHRRQAAAEQQVLSLQSQIRSLQALTKHIPQDTKKLAAYTAAVPTTPDLANALRQIQQAATTAGATLSSVAPSKPSTAASRSTGGTPSIAVALSAAGSYQQLMNFLTALNAMPRTLVVQSVSISGGSTALSAQISSEIFYAG